MDGSLVFLIPVDDSEIEFAGRHACSQIVLGTRGHAGIVGTLLGSVARRVVHAAKVPVMLIHHDNVDV